MKNLSFVLIAFVLALTFTASDIGIDNGSKPESAKKCPYLEKLQQNGLQSECPFLKDLTQDDVSYPFLNGNKDQQTGCPYIDEGSCIECPYLNQQGKGEVKEIKTHPFPEGRNT
jgi:hypothetical protein